MQTGMRGCPYARPTVQLPILLALFLATAIAFAPVNDTILQDCEANSLKIDLAKIDYSKCNVVHSTISSHCYESDKWISTKEWVRNCSCLLKQEYNVETNQISEIKTLRAPVLHCRDDKTISVTWSEIPDNFNPPDNDNAVYLLEIQKQDCAWRLFNVTRCLVSVAQNLEPNTSYRFRVHKVGPGLHLVSSDGEEINTFPPLSNRPAETLSPSKEVYQSSPFTFYSNATASTRIKWEPGQDRTCWYNVIFATVRHDGEIRHMKVYTAETPMEAEISGLKVGLKYNVKVSSLERNHSHSNTFTKDPSCEVFPVNLTLSGPCAPIIKVSHSVTKTTGGITHVDVTVFWDPIPGGPPSNFTVLVQSEDHNNSMVVPGTHSNVTIRNVLVRKVYNATVFASSPGGEGEHAKWPATEIEIVYSTNATYVVIGIGFVGTTIAFLAFIYLKCLRIHKISRRDLISAKQNHLNLNTVARYDEWEIPREKLNIEEEIGRGAFGTVHRALLSRPTGQMEVAVKRLRSDPTSDDARQFRLETEIMKGVDKHPNVLSLVGCVTKPESGMPFEQLLVVEYCAHGDLQSFLRRAWKQMAQQSTCTTYVSVDDRCVQYAQLMSHSEFSSGSTCDDEESGDECSESQTLGVSNQTYGLYLGMEGGIQREGSSEQRFDSEFMVTPSDLLSFARQVAIGMEFLSASRVVHRDLAARNVLVRADRTVKISDFGLSRDIYEQNIYKKAGAERIPVKWMAIESLMHQIYTTQSDVWSFGILLWEIATLGGSPYPSVSNDALFRLLNNGYRMERPSTCGTELYKLMCDCWQADPNKRPNFGDLKRRLDDLLEAAAPHHYIQIDQLFAVTSEENAAAI